jgi:hypothetical protein
MTTCPDCNGARETFAMVHGHRSDGTAFHRSGMMPCRTCKGTGEISDAKAAALVEGERRRQDRIARGLSGREEAARLGITPIELNRIEFAKDTE